MMKEKIELKNIFNKINNESKLYPWQKQDLKEIISIIFQNFSNPKKINILDVGCSVPQVKILSNYVNKVVGINLRFNQDILDENLKTSKYQFIPMDGTQLKFSNQTFDFVYSFNVLEHIHDVKKALLEQKRVTKKGGYIYAAWNPLWSGPRGHHVHDDESFFRGWEQHGKPKTPYKNNGEFIPDWYHLIYTKEEMYKHLHPKFTNQDFTKAVVNYIYKQGDLNRTFIKQYLTIFKELKISEIFIKKNQPVKLPKKTLQLLQNKYGRMDYSILGIKILFCKATIFERPDILLKRLIFKFDQSNNVRKIRHFFVRIKYKINSLK